MQQKAALRAKLGARRAAERRARGRRERGLHRLRQGRRRQVDADREPRRGAGRRGHVASACSTPTSGATRSRACSASAPSGRRSRPSARSSRCEAGGIAVMSIGFFVEEDAAVVWRGPMLHKALKQFLEDVEWGALDFLLIDLPPGTGDVSMTLAQLLPQATFVIVTTPQPAAQRVARRAAEMAHKVYAGDLRRDREHGRLRHPGRRALRDLRRGRRAGARRRARRAAARPRAADDAAARSLRRRHCRWSSRTPTTLPHRRSATRPAG